MNLKELLMEILMENKTPEEYTYSLNKSWLRKYGVESMSGNCGKIATMLYDKLQENGIKSKFVNGRFENDEIGNHAWGTIRKWNYTRPIC